MNKKWIVVLALGAACLSAPAAAAMYRCGSTFQDRPCDSAAEQQTIRPGKGAGQAVVPPAAATPASAPAATAAKPAPAAGNAARAASGASAPKPASAKDGGSQAPSAASTAVPGSATTRTATGGGTSDCGNVRKKGTTLNVGKPGNAKAAEAGC
jgi:hypothetical protein